MSQKSYKKLRQLARKETSQMMESQVIKNFLKFDQDDFMSSIFDQDDFMSSICKMSLFARVKFCLKVIRGRWR
jgi:hypothetical protein